jgi:Ice-binding-like
MARARTLFRLAARLTVVIPFAAFLPAACGGFDTIPLDEIDATADAPLDTFTNETSLSDTPADRTADTGDSSVNETSLSDRPADVSRDAPDADAADAIVVAGDPRLKSASRFAVFAGSAVSNTAITTVTGDLGQFPSTTPVGATPPIVIGAFHLGDPVAGTARTDILAAWTALQPANMPGGTILTGQDLGGKTLPPGIYTFSAAAALTGALVLDAGSVANPEWIFQIGSALTVLPLGATPATVTVIGASPCKVYWQLGSAATLGANTVFAGNILALSSVTLVTGAKLAGRALAVNAAVVMDANTVSIAACP